jgi:glutamate--cysteine ligase
MTTLDHDAGTARVLRKQEEVEERIRAICFKTGPPARLGAELEWTLHHTGAPDAPLDVGLVRQALGRHTPATLGGPPAATATATGPAHAAAAPGGPAHSAAGPGSPAHSAAGPGDPAESAARPSGSAHSAAGRGGSGEDPPPLPAGGRLTAEPGGQIEISSAPADSAADLFSAVTADLEHLTGLLDAGGLSLGEHGIDPHRPPRRLLDTPRYTAMEHVFDRHGPHGRTMMCSTAGFQVCLDAGTPAQLPVRWATVLALGPPLVALFANSARHAGRDTGLASARMSAWWRMDPRLTHPPAGPPDDPAAGWVRYALAAPLVCVRRPGGDWHPPPGSTLRDWAGGALPEPLTVGDLDYHLSTLFPPVRPRGYLEVRYLDAQPGADWVVPFAMLAALFGDHATTEAALEIAAPVAGCWVPAYRFGLRYPALRRSAARLVELAAGRLAATGLPPGVLSHVIETVDKRLRDAEEQR